MKGRKASTALMSMMQVDNSCIHKKKKWKKSHILPHLFLKKQLLLWKHTDPLFVFLSDLLSLDFVQNRRPSALPLREYPTANMALVQVLQHVCSVLSNMEVQNYEFEPLAISLLSNEESEMVHLTNSLLDRLARKQSNKNRFEGFDEMEPPAKKLRFYESPTTADIVLTPNEIRYQDSQGRASWIPNNGAGYFGMYMAFFDLPI
jgi:hypothetical protein